MNQLTFEVEGITWVLNFDFTHHLANDNLKVFVVDFHPLEAVYLLYFVY